MFLAIVLPASHSLALPGPYVVQNPFLMNNALITFFHLKHSFLLLFSYIVRCRRLLLRACAHWCILKKPSSMSKCNNLQVHTMLYLIPFFETFIWNICSSLSFPRSMSLSSTKSLCTIMGFEKKMSSSSEKTKYPRLESNEILLSKPKHWRP